MEKTSHYLTENIEGQQQRYLAACNSTLIMALQDRSRSQSLYSLMPYLSIQMLTSASRIQRSSSLSSIKVFQGHVVI